jgi:hypothetical protein
MSITDGESIADKALCAFFHLMTTMRHTNAKTTRSVMAIDSPAMALVGSLEEEFVEDVAPPNAWIELLA